MIFSQKNISKFFVKAFFPRVLISLIITIGFTTLQSPAWAADGDLDTTFSGDGILTTAIGAGNDAASSVVLQSDGKIVVAGYSYNGSNYDIAVVRYNTDGSLDTTFSGDGILTTTIGSRDDYAESVVVQSDGKIVVAGFYNNGSGNLLTVVRYTDTGSLDTSFSGDGKQVTSDATRGYSVVLQGDKIVVAGYSYNGSNNDIAVVRYNTDGSLDTSFSGDGTVTTAIAISGGHDEANSVVVQGDGKIVVAGYSYNGSNYDLAVVKYNTDGSLDTSFSGDGQVTTAIGLGEDLARSVMLQDQ